MTNQQVVNELSKMTNNAEVLTNCIKKVQFKLLHQKPYRRRKRFNI